MERARLIRGVGGLALFAASIGMFVSLFARDPASGPRHWTDAIFAGILVACWVWLSRSAIRVKMAIALLSAAVPVIAFKHVPAAYWRTQTGIRMLVAMVLIAAAGAGPSLYWERTVNIGGK